MNVLFCIDCDRLTRPDPEAHPETPTCLNCGEHYRCGDCGFEVDGEGICQRAMVLGEPVDLEQRCASTLQEYRFTFGQKYARPEQSKPEGMPFAHPDGWMTVLAPDHLSARIWVLENLGPGWAFMYGPNTWNNTPVEFHTNWYPQGELARFTAPAVRRTRLEFADG